jgi:hypothetical protein
MGVGFKNVSQVCGVGFDEAIGHRAMRHAVRDNAQTAIHAAISQQEKTMLATPMTTARKTMPLRKCSNLKSRDILMSMRLRLG